MITKILLGSKSYDNLEVTELKPYYGCIWGKVIIENKEYKAMLISIGDNKTIPQEWRVTGKWMQ